MLSGVPANGTITAEMAFMCVAEANCRTRRPQKLKCLISLRTNPVSILSAPIQTVHYALNPLNRLTQYLFWRSIGSRNLLIYLIGR